MEPHNQSCDVYRGVNKARIVLLVNLRVFFFRFRVGDELIRKSSENDQLTTHFQSLFIISRKNSETGTVNQQSVLNLKYFIIFITS